MRLEKIIEIKGILYCVTGLRIGGSKDTMEIGGLDNPIIRHPITELPYIPGSSLKGKIRSLLESVYGRRFKNSHDPLNGKNKDNPCMCGQCMVCRIFGSHQNTVHNLGPSRLLVRDAVLTDASVEMLKDAQVEKGLYFSEIKPENIVKRTTGSANNFRNNERVPAGTSFNIHLTLKVYDIDNKEELIKFIKQGLGLLESDYLGSSGSRGYGKVSFKNLDFHEIDVSDIRVD
jgi:CRISPR-associated protein Csm3